MLKLEPYKNMLFSNIVIDTLEGLDDRGHFKTILIALRRRALIKNDQIFKVTLFGFSLLILFNGQNYQTFKFKTGLMFNLSTNY